ncbi:MAG: hypothetical protein ACXVCV_05380 [Polyangia bacterium]
MRLLPVLLALGLAVDALAQESEVPAAQAYPIVQEPSPSPPQPISNLSAAAVRAPLPPTTILRWRHARVLSGFGTAFGLIGTGLSLSSAIYIVATGYPPNANDFLHPARPSDTGPALAYAGASVSAAGFAMSAGGLGWQHRILGELGADRGRGMYIGGTVVGLIGLVAVGAGYFFGLTDYLNPHDQSIAVLTTSLAGTALCTTAAGLYATDSSRVKEIWKSLMTF